MRRSTTLCAAAALAAAGFFAASPADAAFRVIQWNITKVCQIYAFGVDGPPIPTNYRVLTGPLPTFGAALRAKNALWRRGRCLI